MATSATAYLLQMYPVLTSQNFPHWKLRIMTILEEKKVDDAVRITDSEFVTIMSDADKKSAFKPMDASARNLILQSVSDRHIGYIRDAKSAYQMMKNLSAVFERKSTSARFMLMEKLFTIQYEHGEDLQEFFNKLDGIFTELTALGGKMDEQDMICCLLVKLKSQFEAVVAAIDAMNDTLTMNFVKNKLLDAELKRKRESDRGESNQSVDLSAFYANRQNQNSGSYQSTPYHSQNPRNFYPQNRGRGNGRFRRNGYRGGHFGYQSRAFSAELDSAQNPDHTGGEISFVAENIDSNHAFVNQSINHKYQFIIDSGCTLHCVKQELEDEMEDVRTLDTPVQIKVANGQKITATQQGNLFVYAGNCKLRIPALIVPGIVYNLLSVKLCMEKGFDVNFSGGNAEIIHTQSNIRIKGSQQGNLYCVNFNKSRTGGPTASAKCLATQDDDVWHRRLAHLNRRSLRDMGLPASEKICSSCVSGKMTRLPFKPRQHRSTRVGQLLHTDLAGPVKTPGMQGERYWQVILDDYSHFCVVYVLKNKSEAENNLINFIKRLENDKQCTVGAIRCDNGGEVSSNIFKKFCLDKGLAIQYTQKYSSQMNGSAERMNRLLQDRCRAMLNETQLPKSLWTEAIRTAAYALNRSPSRAIDGEIPVRLMNGGVDLERLRVFGAKAWVMKIPRGDKLDDRAIVTRFVGYQDNGFRCYDYISKKIISSRDVRFDESDFVFTESPASSPTFYEEYEDPERIQTPQQVSNQKSPEKRENKLSPKKRENSKKGDEDEDKFYSDDESRDLTAQPGNKKTSRAGRELKTPSHLSEYEMYTAYCLCAEIPSNYEEAMNMGPGWKNAIERELTAHQTFGTWSPSELPEGKKPIETRWVFTRKSDGTAKARLVARGFQEQDSGNVNYAPVARMCTVRTFLSAALMNNWKVSYFDVPTAFLQSRLESQIYIYPPEGVNTKSNVLRLNRPLYGLRESPSAWSQTLHTFLSAFGLERSKRDVCVYTNKKMALVVFVDDILTAGDDEELATALFKKFSARKIPKITEFLGFSLNIEENCIKISQGKSIRKLLDKFRMTDSKDVKTPMENKFQARPGEIVVKPYRELIGSLLYISLTSRPDITYAVAYLSRFLDAPTIELWTAAKRILKYLSTTKDLSLIYTKEKLDSLHVYTDADYAEDVSDRKSTSGFAIFHGNNLVSWGSKKQTAVSQSSTEAEYVAAALAAMEVSYTKGILLELNSNNMIPTLYVDNQSAISLTKSDENSKRTKHIDVKAHYVRDLYAKNEIKIKYVPTAENVSDIFTKALNFDKFGKFRQLMVQ